MILQKKVKYIAYTSKHYEERPKSLQGNFVDKMFPKQHFWRKQDINVMLPFSPGFQTTLLNKEIDADQTHNC